MLNNNFLTDALNKALPHPRKKVNNGVNVNCPMCLSRGEARPDTKYRCGVRFFPNGALAINCFNCGFVTRWNPGTMLGRNVRSFLQGIGVTDLDIKKLNFTAWQLSQNPEERKEVERAIFVPKFDTVELPKDAKPISLWAEYGCDDQDFLQVVEYAATRGDAVFNNHEFYWTPDREHNMNRRLIVPFYWKDSIVGWAGRAIDPGREPRYYANTPAHYLYHNANLYKDRKYVILVEGIFDALSIDGVATQGAKVSDEQAYWLKDTGKQIIVLPDRDKKGQTMIDLAVQNDWMVSFPEWDTGIKDANDAVKKYGKLFTVRSIIDGATDNKLKINLSRKKW